MQSLAPSDHRSVQPSIKGATPKRSPSLSLVLPAWNEAEVIGQAIAEAESALSDLADRYEIIVVDDGSTDQTSALVREAARLNPAIRLIRHDDNLGYGAALRNGFAAATCDLVAFTDADCQFDLTELDRLVFLSQQYDIVCGYRIDRKDSRLRCFYSRVYNGIVRCLLGTEVRDVDCALKLFHREVVQDLTISTSGFLVNSELLTEAKKQGHSVVEVGVSHRPRAAGNSTVSAAHIPKVLAGLVRYWWNTIQFPSVATAGVVSGPFSIVHGLLLVVAALFLFTNLGYPLIDRDETRYAEIPREMLVSGNWVLPQLNFQPYYDKPPLLYWLCAISYRVFGVSEWSARLVPALAAFGTLLATMWFGNRNFGSRIGLFATGVLMLSVGFVFTSRYLLIDGVLTLLTTLSLFSVYEAIKPAVGKRTLHLGWWLAAATFCGLAFLTKGPLALVLLLPPLIVFSWLTESYVAPTIRHYLMLLGVVAGITAPWLVAVSMQAPSFLVEFFYRHNVARFAGEFHARPIWFFIPVLLLAGHPWTFLTIPYAGFLTSRTRSVSQSRPPVLGFMMLWSGWCFVFFSIAKCKLPTYLLPAAPALSLMVGHYLVYVTKRSATHPREWFARFWSARTATATTCLAGVGFSAFIALTGANVSIANYVWILIWTSLLVGSLLMIADRHQVKYAWGSSSALALLLAVMVMHQIVPAYSRRQTIFAAASPSLAKIPLNAELPIATLSHEFSEVPFYLQRSDVRHFDGNNATALGEFIAENEHALIIMEKHVLIGQLRERLPDGTRIQLIDERGPARLLQVTASPSRLARQNVTHLQ
ncbi:Undecaprenyl phosphate-alpha-4-amino-4-deoxy-L-arabinose arabinosyl transferase [Stieleria neptunia]|uniref:Undecaprenyl phosphate-alpha-4-amino-4-deoxy-L-arabinose arabinosyl transferase n=1 Tax=Stieleria neptunia TaxID=2527979 RepID=A0A518HIP8_9BACT|nr:glycosyltransferase [Stieleria neptunia]QDV40727.1 Undecaprenyl phosphate-alpha-4-amino-4-deoxy-L-arabinose arabinosyl transferase [Stieleria neptunia]